MQLSQVPAWIGFVVGALVTLLGVVIAQWNTGKRERNRLEHDRTIDLAKLRADHQASWREMKVRTYSQFLMKLRNAEAMLGAMRTRSDFESAYIDFRSHMETFGETTSEIELISSPGVEKFMHDGENVAKIRQLSYLPNTQGGMSNFAQTGDANHPAVKRLEQLYADVRDYRRGFLAAAREELGVDGLMTTGLN